MFGYIYKTTDINGKIYIGQHHGNFDHYYFGSGSIISKIIHKRKPLLIVELIEECDNQDELNKKEDYWIDKYNSRNPDFGYNILPGGQCYDYSKVYKQSEETNKKKSLSLKGKRNLIYTNNILKKQDWVHTFQSKLE